MESEHTENGRDIKARPIDEKETVCNRAAADAVFRESIVILKIGGSHGNGEWKHSCVCRGGFLNFWTNGGEYGILIRIDKFFVDRDREADNGK